MKKICLGFVPAHRFPSDEEWAVALRQRCVKALRGIGEVELVVPSVSLVHNGLVRDDAGAQATINLFAEKGVQGIILGAMTFGDEVSAVRIAEALDVPVLVFGTKEGPFTPDGKRRSDAFCGTLAITSGLYRRKIPHLLMGIVWPEEELFARTVRTFARACAAVQGFLGARIGVVGARPERGETCMANEAALIRAFRQRVLPISLPEVLNAALAWPEDDHHVLATLADMKREANCQACSPAALLKAARLEQTLQRCFRERELAAMAIACGTDLPEHYGICPCSTLSRLTTQGLLTACEADIYGAATMRVQYLASLETALPYSMDWTIQHQERENVFLAWHCGNAPLSLAADPNLAVIREQAVMSELVGPDRAQCAFEFRLKPGAVTLCRLAEYEGAFKLLIVSGEVLPSEDKLRGTWGWVQVSDLARLYRALAEEGFPPHASLIHGDIADAMEAFCKFTGIAVVRV